MGVIEMGSSYTYFVTVEETGMSGERKNETVQGYGAECAGEIALEIAKSEYDQGLKRLDRFDNKVYILLTAYAILFGYFSAQFSDAANTLFPKTATEMLVLELFALCGITLVVPIIMLLFLLRGINMQHPPVGEIVSQGMVDMEKFQALRYLTMLYVKCTLINNQTLQKRYQKYKLCVYCMIANVALLVLVTISNHMA